MRSFLLPALRLFFTGLTSARAAQPFTQATVTRLENDVSYGRQQGGQAATRPAEIKDTIKANNFLVSERRSRAELQYLDGSIVRVGENTVFSFQAESRTLALSKGMFFFYVPRGQGSTNIKTPSLAVAITGTVGQVTTSMIVILDGTVRLIPSKRTVVAGQFARRNADGSITIDWFDKRFAPRGAVISATGAAVRKGLDRDVLDLAKRHDDGRREQAAEEEKKTAKKADPVMAKPVHVAAKMAAQDAAREAARTASRMATRDATTKAAAQAAAAAAAAASKSASKDASKEASKKAAKPSAPHHMH